MASPPNFLSFAALNHAQATRIASPMQSPFLSPFPSSPSSPGLEPRRTKSRHMDTFSFFDSKVHGYPSSRGGQQSSHTNSGSLDSSANHYGSQGGQNGVQSLHQSHEHSSGHPPNLPPGMSGQMQNLPGGMHHVQMPTSHHHQHQHHQQQQQQQHSLQQQQNQQHQQQHFHHLPPHSMTQQQHMPLQASQHRLGHGPGNGNPPPVGMYGHNGHYPHPQQVVAGRWDPYSMQGSGGMPVAHAGRGPMTGPAGGFGHPRPPVPRQWSQQDGPPGPHDLDSAQQTPISALMSPGTGTVIGEDGDEVIATAVVVKNIPFSLKKETLLELFDQMSLPRPYAFNYHFDNGTFRGLAFANFHSPEETQHVIRIMNGYELLGRKLRVEYKKVLPAEQRERIEMQKRQKALQEDPIIAASMHVKQEKKSELDLNDPATLQIYSSLLLFRDDTTPNARTQIAFPPEYSPQQRRIVHLIAQKLGLEHTSRGEGDDRYVVISKPDNVSESSGSSQIGARTEPTPATGAQAVQAAGAGVMSSSGSGSSPVDAQPTPSNDYTQASSNLHQSHGNGNGNPHGLRIDTRTDHPRAGGSGVGAGPSPLPPHMAPPGLKQMKSYNDLRAPSPLRSSGFNDYLPNPPASASALGNPSFSSPRPTYPAATGSPGLGGIVGSMADMSMQVGGSAPLRQPKGPEPQNRNAFATRSGLPNHKDGM